MRPKGREDVYDKSAVCSNYNRTEHEATSCFQQIGYPDWWGERPRTEGKSGGRGRGRSSNIGRGKSNNVQANAAQTSPGGLTAKISNAEKSGLPNLSDDQWQTLVEMLNNYKGNTNERMTCKGNEWIIDTGAFNHMTRNLINLHELKDMQGCRVGLPDGKQTTATKKGTATLDGGLKLGNVLYVPKLNCNLIFVSQLVDEAKCSVQFTNSLCYVGPHFEDAYWCG